jgi:hypothetical protein
MTLAGAAMEDELILECPRCGESKGRQMLSVCFGVLCSKCGFFWFEPTNPLLGANPDVPDVAFWQAEGQTIH